jgi:hypothetical protein
MTKTARVRWWSIRLGMLLVLAVALSGAGPAPAHAARIQIVTFY